jgi:hypothetical protein
MFLLFRKRFHCDFFEIDHIFFPMVLKSEKAEIGAGTPEGFKIKFPGRNRVPIGVICDLHPV